MRIIIIGAGIIGATSAHALAKAGHQVTVIEKAPEPGQGVSAANGGQLSYGYAEPLAGPDIWTRLPSILLGQEGAIRLRLSWDPDFWRWAIAFLGECRQEAQIRNLQALLELATESQAALRDLVVAEKLDFSYRRAGKLILYRDQKSLDRAALLARVKRELGFEIDVLSADQCRQREPGLDQYPHPIAGGIYAIEDEVGDCQAFTRDLLLRTSERFGAELRLNEPVKRLMSDGSRVQGVETESGPLPADAVVLAAGISAPVLAREIGIHLPIYPVKGYSLTAPALEDAPWLSLTDREERVVFARLGDRLRVAAFADIQGWNGAVDPRRARELPALAQRLFPKAAQWEAATPIWMGQRPMTPSGLPLIGRSELPGLYLNVGHGGLGWTLGCGAARRLLKELPA